MYEYAYCCYSPNERIFHLCWILSFCIWLVKNIFGDGFGRGNPPRTKWFVFLRFVIVHQRHGNRHCEFFPISCQLNYAGNNSGNSCAEDPQQGHCDVVFVPKHATTWLQISPLLPREPLTNCCCVGSAESVYCIFLLHVGAKTSEKRNFTKVTMRKVWWILGHVLFLRRLRELTLFSCRVVRLMLYT